MNKEDIFLTVNTFKKFCLKSSTKKAEEIHDYFIKLEEIIQETIYEQAKDLSIQLKNKEDMNMDLIEKQRKLEEAHKKIIYKRTRHKLKKGKCLYVLESKDNENNCRYKFGVSSSLTSRVSSYNTYGLNDFIFIIFTEGNKILENLLKIKFKSKIFSIGVEWVTNIEPEEIIEYITKVADLTELQYTIYNNIEELYVDDENKIEENDTEEDEVQEEEIIETSEEREKIKKCNKCQQVQELTAFNKDRTKKDGLQTICRSCEKENKKKYKEKKAQNLEPIKEKKCGICNEIKDVSNFSKHDYTKDGYVSNCYECVRKYSKSSTDRRLDIENKIKYTCGNCKTEYSRRDTLMRHLKSCDMKPTTS